MHFNKISVVWMETIFTNLVALDIQVLEYLEKKVIVILTSKTLSVVF